LISEIIVDVLADKIALIIHWQGGDHTRLEVAKNKAGQTRWTTDVDIVKLVQVLARQMPDAAIAAALNRTVSLPGTEMAGRVQLSVHCVINAELRSTVTGNVTSVVR
jgi:hypothetical protein